MAIGATRIENYGIRTRHGPVSPPLDFFPIYTYNVNIMAIEFRWDEKKDRTNRRKHGVSFDEASTAFYDENAKLYFDPDHSDTEDRFLLLGMSFRLRVLVVCHCYRENDAVIRIISARQADKDEETDYWTERA